MPAGKVCYTEVSGVGGVGAIREVLDVSGACLRGECGTGYEWRFGSGD